MATAMPTQITSRIASRTPSPNSPQRCAIRLSTPTRRRRRDNVFSSMRATSESRAEPTRAEPCRAVPCRAQPANQETKHKLIKCNKLNYRNIKLNVSIGSPSLILSQIHNEHYIESKTIEAREKERKKKKNILS